ncbi:phage integrase N-terminal SAM-like domain-containing protein [Pseudomonas sp. NPDC047961]
MYKEVIHHGWKAAIARQVRDQIRLKHYSIRTERVYCEWVKRYIRYSQISTSA